MGATEVCVLFFLEDIAPTGGNLTKLTRTDILPSHPASA
jgi:hypothetical protein